MTARPAAPMTAHSPAPPVTALGASYTGQLSTGHGTGRRTAATVELPGVAARQDVGLAMSAAHGGGGARGTAEFASWRRVSE